MARQLAPAYIPSSVLVNKFIKQPIYASTSSPQLLKDLLIGSFYYIWPI